MIARASRQGWLGRLLALVAAVFLLAGPLTPAMAQSMEDCCPDAACHDMNHGQDKSTCPSVCAVGCVTAPAPQQSLVDAPSPIVQRPVPLPIPRLMGRTLAPEPRPPR